MGGGSAKVTPIFSSEKGGEMGLYTFQKANATSRLHFAACIFRDKADLRQKRKATILNEKLVILFFIFLRQRSQYWLYTYCVLQQTFYSTKRPTKNRFVCFSKPGLFQASTFRADCDQNFCLKHFLLL